jgi:hypothetical protein
MGNLGEYVFKKEGEVMAMNLSPNIFYISSCGDKCNCPLVDALSSSSSMRTVEMQINIFCVVLPTSSLALVVGSCVVVTFYR